MTHSFEREDIPLPTPIDTVVEILSAGEPKAVTELFAMSEKLGRGHTIGKIRSACQHLLRQDKIIVAAGYALVPSGNGRCAKRYWLA